MSPIAELPIPVDPERIAAFCERWQVLEFSVFGSVLRDDFGPDSDVDVLLSIDDKARLGLWDLAAMQEELEELFGRKVDIVEKEGLRNPFRRKTILATRKVLYAA